MAAPIVVNPRREVPAWERLMPYLQQMAQQKRAQKFKIQEREENQQFLTEQATKLHKRQMERDDKKASNRAPTLMDLNMVKVGDTIVKLTRGKDGRIQANPLYKGEAKWSDPIAAKEGDKSGYAPGTWYTRDSKTNKTERMDNADNAKLTQYEYYRGQGGKDKFHVWDRKNRRAGAMSIGDSALKTEANAIARSKAYVTGPKLKIEATKAASSKYGNAEWNWMEPEAKDTAILEEMGRQVKAVYPNAKLNEKNNVLGWYVGEKLIQRYE